MFNRLKKVYAQYKDYAQVDLTLYVLMFAAILIFGALVIIFR